MCPRFSANMTGCDFSTIALQFKSIFRDYNLARIVSRPCFPDSFIIPDQMLPNWKEIYSTSKIGCLFSGFLKPYFARVVK